MTDADLDFDTLLGLTKEDEDVLLNHAIIFANGPPPAKQELCERRRQRNREAAARSRKRKLEYVSLLKVRVRELQAEVHALRHENLHLRSMGDPHATSRAGVHALNGSGLTMRVTTASGRPESGCAHADGTSASRSESTEAASTPNDCERL